MKIKIVFFLCIFISCIGKIQAQTDSLFWNSEMIKIATPTSNADWINIRPEVNINPLTFFSTHKSALALGANDEMRLHKTEEDKIGMIHHKYQQFYKGYRIIFGEFILHAKNAKLITANGKMIKGLNKSPVIRISKEVALQNAMRFLPAPRYAWEIPQLENMYKETMRDPNATYKPLAELVWISTDHNVDSKNTANYELAFTYDIYPASMNGKRIFVSAADGRIIRSLPLSSKCDAASIASTFYGTQGVLTRLIPSSSPPRWNLWNDCQNAFIHTRQWVNDSTSNEYVSTSGNNWSAARSAASSHWATERAYSYFFDIHARNGWNNNFGGVNVFHDALFCYTNGCTPTDPDNASMTFDGGIMKVGNAGNGADIDDWNSADIIAHEFTHAVTASSFAALIYQQEPGALNESFSDIFGVTCQAWLFGLNANSWKIGFDRKNPLNTSQSLYLRNLANPNDKNDPDTYLSPTWWVSTTTPTDVGGDNWGVHTNSGVQNYMYYLLTNGGSGTNDNGTPFSLIGIGIVAAREIAYRALTIGYLFSTSGFAQARTAWVHAAVDLYGECSIQAIQTGKAWDAVGLPPPSNTQYTPYCGTYGNSIFSVTSPNIYSLAFNCTMFINPASLVQFGANKVVLNPGFRAQNGSSFRAYVSDCRYAAY